MQHGGSGRIERRMSDVQLAQPPGLGTSPSPGASGSHPTNAAETRWIHMKDASVEEAVGRIANAISCRHAGGSGVVLVGIQTGGVCLARSLAARLAEKWHHPVPVGQLDVAMHRDDLDQRLAPKVHPTSIAFDVSGKRVILVDDVLCSGRTTRAALDALLDLGRPQRVELAVLIDRPHRELPIQADFVGATLETQPEDRVDVQWSDGNGVSQVVIESTRRQPSSAP